MGGDRNSSRGRRSRRSHDGSAPTPTSKRNCSSRPLPLLCCPPAECRCRCLGWDAERRSEISSDSSAWNASPCPRQAMGCTERSRGVGPFERAGAALSEHFLSLPQLCVLCLCSSMLQLDRHPLARHRFAPVVSASRFTRSSLAASPLAPLPLLLQGCLFDCVPASEGQRHQQKRWRRACSRAASHCGLTPTTAH